jgi:hypothetical protein
MRFTKLALFLASISWPAAGVAQDSAEIGRIADTMVRLCLAGEALQEWTRARVPLEWAGTQMNLGAALNVLGERESGTARLEEAVSAYREALQEWTRARAAPMGRDPDESRLGLSRLIQQGPPATSSR